MDVAAQIEVGSPRPAELGQGRPQTGTRANPQIRFDAASTAPDSIEQPVAVSFRSNWERQLASFEKGAVDDAEAETRTSRGVVDLRGADAPAPEFYDLETNFPSAPPSFNALSQAPQSEPSFLKQRIPATRQASSNAKASRAQATPVIKARSTDRQTAISLHNYTANTDPQHSASVHSSVPIQGSTRESSLGTNDPETAALALNPSPLIQTSPINAIPTPEKIEIAFWPLQSSLAAMNNANLVENSLSTSSSAASYRPTLNGLSSHFAGSEATHSPSSEARGSLSSSRSGHTAPDTFQLQSSAPTAALNPGPGVSARGHIQHRESKADLDLVNVSEQITRPPDLALPSRHQASALVDSSNRVDESDDSISASPLAAPIHSAKTVTDSAKRSSERAMSRHPQLNVPFESAPPKNPITASSASVPSASAMMVDGDPGAATGTPNQFIRSVEWSSAARSNIQTAPPHLGSNDGSVSTTARLRRVSSRQGTEDTQTRPESLEEAVRPSPNSSQPPDNSEKLSSSVAAQSMIEDAQTRSIQSQVESHEQSESLRVSAVPAADFAHEANQTVNATGSDAAPGNGPQSKAAKFGFTANMKASEQGSPRSIQALERMGPAEIRPHTDQAQAIASVPDPAASSPLSHDPSAQQGFMSQTRDNFLASQIPASSVALRETFSSLDAGADNATTNWIHAGTQHAEAGFQDPALGWVGVRADLNADGIHATLTPGTADAAQALGSHLAGLHAHLAAEHVPVTSVLLAPAKGSEAGMGGNQGMSQETGQNPDGHAPPQPQAGTQTFQQPRTLLAATDSPERADASASFAGISRPKGSSFSAMA